MAERVMEGAGTYDEARCILPGCGKQLHITWTSGRPVYLSDTDDMLRDPSSAHTSTWQIGCENGHVVLLPPDTGEDYYEFAGRCTCMEDYPDPESEQACSHNDMTRLRAVCLGKEVPANGR